MTGRAAEVAILIVSYNTAQALEECLESLQAQRRTINQQVIVVDNGSTDGSVLFNRDRDIPWYVAYPISYRQLEEMMEEREVEVDHSTLNRWVVKYAHRRLRSRKRGVGSGGRLDETYAKIKGSWKYLS